MRQRGQLAAAECPRARPPVPATSTGSPSSVTRAPGSTASDGSSATTPSTATRPLRTSPSTPAPRAEPRQREVAVEASRRHVRRPRRGAAAARARRAQRPERPGRQRAQAQAAVGRAVQREHVVPDRLAHAAHLALAALVQHDLDDALPARGAQHAHAGRRRAPPVQLHARRRAAAAVSRADGPTHRRLVGLLDAVARMHQPRGQLAVVREQQQPGRVGVQPPDREEPASAPTSSITVCRPCVSRTVVTTSAGLCSST